MTPLIQIGVILVAGTILIVCLLLQTYSHGKSIKEMTRQLEQFVAIAHSHDHQDPLQEQLNSSCLPQPVRHSMQALAEHISGHQEKLVDLQQKSANAEVKVHLGDIQIAKIRKIIDDLVEPVLMTNHYGEISLINPAARNLLNVPESAQGADIAEVVPCEQLVQLMNEMCRRKLKSSRIAEFELEDASGEKHWYRVTASTICAEAVGNVSSDSAFGAVAVMRDISGYKAIQRRNAEFVSAVSHEMKTPLAGIKAYVELLADGEDEDEETRDEFLSIINGQADRLQRLIDNLLNLARIEAGVVSVSKKPRSLNDLLVEAASIVQPTSEQNNIQLHVDLSPLYLGVLADRDMILQAAINLLSNAVKYTPEGGSVTLRSRLADREVHFEVEDTGVGLSSEDCEMVFEKFYRVKKDQKMASGTGLGLPLAKHIVEDVHGGSLTVRSKLGQGSTFIIALPTVQVMEHTSQ